MEVVAYIMAVVVVLSLVVIAFTTLGPAINIAYPAKHLSFTSNLEEQRHK